MTRARDVASNGGLVLVNTTTFSAQATVAINNVFTSSYANYVLEFDGSTTAGSGSQYVYFNLSASGTAAANTNWVDMILYTADASGPTRSGAAGASPARMFFTANNYSTGTAQIKNPQLAQKTVMTFASYERSSVDIAIMNGGALFNATTQFDGLVLTSSGGGTLSGTVRIYGMRN